MADYNELRSLLDDNDLRNRVIVATAIAAQGLMAAGVVDNLKWASSVLAEPKPEGMKAFKYILTENKSLTVAQFGSVTDEQIQAGVDALVPKLIIAFNAG